MNFVYDSATPITHTFITDTSLTINQKQLAAKPMHANFDDRCKSNLNGSIIISNSMMGAIQDWPSGAKSSLNSAVGSLTEFFVVMRTAVNESQRFGEHVRIFIKLLKLKS